MFNNESILKSIARRVFPNLGAFSSDGVAKLGLWDAYISVGEGVAWMTIYFNTDMLFCIEVSKGRVKATYALPAIMERAGEKEYGTAQANSRRWRADGWSDVPAISVGIQKFFDNIDEFLEEEAKVYKILEETE